MILNFNQPCLARGTESLKLKNSVLVQKNSSSLYSNFILNLYIVYELNTCPRTACNNFALKKCLFGTVMLVRNAIKSKFIYNGVNGSTGALEKNYVLTLVKQRQNNP